MREDRQDDRMAAGVVQLLERKPAVAAPADFAQRVMARIPSAPRPARRSFGVSRASRHYGQIAAWACVALLVAGMYALAVYGNGKGAVVFTLQLLALVQLTAVLAVIAFTAHARSRA